MNVEVRNRVVRNGAGDRENWQVAPCPNCQAQVRVNVETGESQSVSCPACNAQYTAQG